MHLWNCWLQGLLSLKKPVFKKIEHLGHTPSKTSTHFLVTTYSSTRKKKIAKTLVHPPKQILQEKRPSWMIGLSSSYLHPMFRCRLLEAVRNGLGDETSDFLGSIDSSDGLCCWFICFFCLEYSKKNSFQKQKTWNCEHHWFEKVKTLMDIIDSILNDFGFQTDLQVETLFRV